MNKSDKICKIRGGNCLPEQDKKMPSEKSRYDRCVYCGQLTEFTVDTPICLRKYYIQGGGQLCRDCYEDIMCSGAFRREDGDGGGFPVKLKEDAPVK